MLLCMFEAFYFLIVRSNIKSRKKKLYFSFKRSYSVSHQSFSFTLLILHLLIYFALFACARDINVLQYTSIFVYGICRIHLICHKYLVGVCLTVICLGKQPFDFAVVLRLSMYVNVKTGQNDECGRIEKSKI